MKSNFFKVEREEFIKAQIELTPGEWCVYCLLLYKFNGSNNGDLTIHLRELFGDVFGIKQTSLRKHLKTLCQKGYLSLVVVGGGRKQNRYAITKFPY